MSGANRTANSNVSILCPDPTNLYTSESITIAPRIADDDLEDYGIAIRNDDGNVVFTDRDRYPRVIFSDSYTDLQNMSLSSVINITHPAPVLGSAVWISFFLNLARVERLRRSNGNRDLDQFILGVYRVSDTQLQIRWGLETTLRLNSGTFDESWDDITNLNGQLNGRLVLFDVPDVTTRV